MNLKNVNIPVIVAVTVLTFTIIHHPVYAETLFPNGMTFTYSSDLYLPTTGGTFGMERYLFQSTKYTIIGSAHLLFRQYPDVNISAGLTATTTLRRTFKPGIFLEHGLLLGYMGSYYSVDCYKVTDDKKIINMAETWQSSVIGGYTFGGGYDFSSLTKLNLQLFLRPAFYLRYPNLSNIWIKHNYRLIFGISYHPSWIQWK